MQILDMNVELKCNQLPAFVSKLNKLPNELILTLKIHLLTESQLIDISCQKVAPLLGALNQPHRLKELTLVLPSFHLLSSQEWIRFTELRHLSINFDSNNYLGSVNEKDFGRLHVLNKLVSLEICNTQFGNSAMESLLKSLPKLTLQKLTLDNDNLTDHDVGLLANILSHSMYELESLSLCNNSITGRGINALVKVLKSHSKFYSFDLSGNPVKENEGLEALKELSTLRVLNLTN